MIKDAVTIEIDIITYGPNIIRNISFSNNYYLINHLQIIIVKTLHDDLFLSENIQLLTVVLDN